MINVHDLEITNVTQEYWTETSIDINFDLLTDQYQLHVSQDEKGIFHPFEIFHVRNFSDCLYCDGNDARCPGLRVYRYDFFRRLIEFPSIRLEWLYLTHAVKA